MKFRVVVQFRVSCSVERAFKTPMLCDVTFIHTGYGLMPMIISVSHDQDWGKPGSSKKIYAAKSITQPGGFVSMDHVLERIENERWEIQVDQFQSWMLGFYQFNGTWETKEISPHLIQITYTYHLFGKGVLLIPLQWLFAKVFWKRYMKRVCKNIETLIVTESHYLYD
ncbi:MAG: hypothetical protein EB038_08855 [Cyclobacteriaceae bacterium]|nr:hypothetical protein [Cyclobacteriaceae bacterium]